jgi:hypothetical protein
VEEIKCVEEPCSGARMVRAYLKEGLSGQRAGSKGK